MILGELLYRISEAGITLRCGRIEHWLNASPASILTAVSGGLIRQPTGRGVDREAKRGAQEPDMYLQAREAMRGLEAEREEREEDQRAKAMLEIQRWTPWTGAGRFVLTPGISIYSEPHYP